jgi:hypothetical protein
MDNVQKHKFNNIPSSLMLDLIKEKPVFKMQESFCVTESCVSELLLSRPLVPSIRPGSPTAGTSHTSCEMLC